METEITYGICRIEDGWHVMLNSIPIKPPFRAEEVAKVFMKCLRAGALQDIFEIKEALFDKVFKEQNEGR